MTPRAKIDVRRELLQTMVEDLASGKYFLPSFQRQFVWDEDDIKDLIDSMIRNYPIGTIILWKPSTALVGQIDPFSTPLVGSTKQGGKEVYYVIDGQQRLTSLLLLLNDWKVERAGEVIERGPISYNPANKKFYKSTRRGIDLSELIRAFYHYDDNAIASLKKRTPQGSYKEMEEMIKGVLNKYPISICTMETSREDEETFRDMAEAFIRVNKYGVRIGNLELMLSFLAGAVSRELKSRISALYEEVYGQFQLDLQPVIRIAFSNFGLKQTQISKVDQFRRTVRTVAEKDRTEIDKVFRRSATATKLAVDLLRQELGLATAALLPSQIAIVPIAKYLYARGAKSTDELEEEDRERIANWFVLASVNGYYSSQTDTKLDRDLETITRAEFPWRKLIGHMEERRARTKISRGDVEKGLRLNVLRAQGRAYLFLLYVLLVKNGAENWNGTLLRETVHTDLARHHLFPQEFLGQELELEEPEAEEVLVSNIANITFIHKDINSEIEDTPPDSYMRTYVEAAKRHFVPMEENLWSIGQYETFLSYRVRQMHAAGRKFFREIFE